MRKQIRRNGPLHKRVMLHPVSVFFLLCVGVAIGGVTLHSFADSYTVRAKVSAPLPTAAATIDTPADQTHTSSQQLNVSGSCPSDTYIKLDDNGITQGIALCDNATNMYAVTIGLTDGSNLLQARVFNITDDEGPLSAPITVWYNPPVSAQPSGKTTPHPQTTASGSPASAAPSEPLLIAENDYHYQVYSSGQSVSWSLSLRGGESPFKLAVDWGDGTSDTKQIANHDPFTLTHTYPASPDLVTYVVKLVSTDARGTKAFFQTIASVKGASAERSITGGAAASVAGGGSANFKTGLQNWLWLIWPTYGVVTLMAASFWLGELQKSSTLALRPAKVRSSAHQRSRRRR